MKNQLNVPKEILPRVEEIRELQEDWFKSPIFNYKSLDKAGGLCVKISGICKKNIKWEAREVWEIDLANYESILTNEEVVKYYYQERPWTKEEIRTQMDESINSYQNGQPLGTLTIFEKQGDFIGKVLIWSERQGISEIAYALLPKYWGMGIGQSVLSKIVKEWGSEVRKIGLGEGFDSKDEQNKVIKRKFQCFKGEELKQFHATAKPTNIPSWSILEKVGFEPAKTEVKNLGNPIHFSDKSFDLLLLGNLFDYYSRIEYCIEDLYQKHEIEVDNNYFMTDNNNKLHTFSRKSDGRIRFHYEKDIR